MLQLTARVVCRIVAVAVLTAVVEPKRPAKGKWIRVTAVYSCTAVRTAVPVLFFFKKIATT